MEVFLFTFSALLLFCVFFNFLLLLFLKIAFFGGFCFGIEAGVESFLDCSRPCEFV